MENEMMSLQGKTILFICPEFYDYPDEIIRTFRTMGATVVFYSEIKINFLFRIKKNIHHKLLDKHVKSYYDRIKIEISKMSFDYFFLIRGKYTRKDFILDFIVNNRKCVLLYYQWDSLKLIPNAKIIVDLFHFSYSFDIDDCNENNSYKYLPTFCVEKYFNLPKICCMYKYDLLFIGSLTNYRYDKLMQFQSICNSQDISFYMYAYMPFVEYVKERFIRKNKIKLCDVKFLPLKSEGVLRLYKISNTILDIPDINQSGYPLRIYEALGAKKKIITTSLNIHKEQFYSKSNIYMLNNGYDGIKSFIPTRGEFDNIKINSTESWIREIFRLN